MLGWLKARICSSAARVSVLLLVCCVPKTRALHAQEQTAWPLASDECLVYAGWRPNINPDATSNNHTEQLLAEPEVRAFFDEVQLKLGSIEQLVIGNRAERNAELRSMVGIADLLPDLSRIFFSKPGCYYINSVTPGRNGIEISAGFVSEFGDSAPQLLDDILERVPTEQRSQLGKIKLGGNEFHELRLPPPVTSSILFGAANDRLILAIGRNEAERIVNATAQSSSSTASRTTPWLDELQRSLPIPRRSSVAYYNVKAISQLVYAFGGPQIAMYRSLINAMGLDRIASIETSAGLDNKGMQSRSLVRLSGKAIGAVRVLGGVPLDKSALESLPADTMFAAIFSLDLSSALTDLLAIIQEEAPTQTRQLDSFLEQLNQFVGCNVRKDIIDKLGSAWTIYNASGDGLGTGLIAKAQLRDPDGLQETLEKIIEMLSEAGRDNSDIPQIAKRELSDTSIYSVSFNDPRIPLRPSFAIIGDELVVSLFASNLLPIADGSALEETLDVSQYIANQSRVTAFSFSDTRRQYEYLYGYASLMHTFIPTAILEDGPPGGFSYGIANMLRTLDLPSARSVGRHLQPSVSIAQQTRDGIRWTKWKTIPSVNIAVATPVGVGLLLPAVQAAREAARRVQSSNNLKQLVLALHDHESAHRYFPPSYTTDRSGQPLLSWRVHLLPFLEQTRLYKEFHLDEPWNSPHNIKLLPRMPVAFRSPASSAPLGHTTYRGIGGPKGILQPPRRNSRSNQGTTFGSITDRISNTIMVIEVSDDLAVEWTKPENFEPSDEELKRILGAFRGGTNVGMGDGAVQFLSEAIDLELLRHMMTMNGGESPAR
ncbi:MAG: hypothetical protein Aurels2KO_32650 [Aureliella sp.]